MKEFYPPTNRLTQTTKQPNTSTTSGSTTIQHTSRYNQKSEHYQQPHLQEAVQPSNKRIGTNYETQPTTAGT